MGPTFIKSNSDNSKKRNSTYSCYIKGRLKNSLQENLMESQLKTRQNKINILAENQLQLKKQQNQKNILKIKKNP